MGNIINPFDLKDADYFKPSTATFPEVFFHLTDHTLCEMSSQNGGRRMYTDKNGNQYPSITTIISATMPADKRKSLQDWEDRIGKKEAQRIRTESTIRGTALHELIECYLKDVNFKEEYHNAAPKVKFLFEQVYPELQNIEEIYALEDVLYSSKVKVAGRVDLVGKYKAKRSVVDFKSSTNQKEDWMILDYYIQETAYGLMYGEHYPKNRIEQIVTIIATETDTKATVFIKDPKDYILPLMQRVKEFYALAV